MPGSSHAPPVSGIPWDAHAPPTYKRYLWLIPLDHPPGGIPATLRASTPKHVRASSKLPLQALPWGILARENLQALRFFPLHLQPRPATSPYCL